MVGTPSSVDIEIIELIANLGTKGHCRRRKIRCLLAPEDPQNRCANCIRLKKECSFFPVDQQPPVERGNRTASKVEARASTSTDSSPALVGGHLFNQNEHFNPYPMLAHSAPEFPPTTASMGGGLVSPLTRGKRFYLLWECTR